MGGSGADRRRAVPPDVPDGELGRQRSGREQDEQGEEEDAEQDEEEQGGRGGGAGAGGGARRRRSRTRSKEEQDQEHLAGSNVAPASVLLCTQPETGFEISPPPVSPARPPNPQII